MRILERCKMSEDAVIFHDQINLETSMNNIVICPVSWRTFGLTAFMSGQIQCWITSRDHFIDK